MIVRHILKGLMKGVFPCFRVYWQSVNNSFLTTPFSFETGKALRLGKTRRMFSLRRFSEL